MKSTTSKRRMQGRRAIPKIRRKARVAVEQAVLTVGDLIAAACEALGDEEAVTRVLGSSRMAEQVGRKLVFV
jgi:hypothetical protein